MNKIDVGDTVIARGIKVVVGEIIYQEYYDETGYSIEFIDSRGDYRDWKQSVDGGQLIKGGSNHE